MRAVRARLCAADARDAGLTLIELLVTMILMGVVSSLVLAAVAQAGRIVTHNEDEETGLQDAKVVFDRVGRDIRESRGVRCDGGLADPGDLTSLDPQCAGHLQLWVDSNSDYVEQATEIITWRLEWNVDAIHHDVWRIQGTGAGGTPTSAHLQASSLIVDAVFGYYGPNGALVASPDTAQRVDITLSYDSIVGRGSGDRTVEFSARLRNKG